MTMRNWWWWLAVLAWGAMIWTLSSSPFRSSESKSLLERILEYFSLRPEFAAYANTVLRKAAHFAEYGLFSVLWYFALRPDGDPGIRQWSRRPAWAAVLASSAFAVLDEFHQAFVPGRGASLFDVFIDSAGALFSILVLYRLACKRPQ